VDQDLVGVEAARQQLGRVALAAVEPGQRLGVAAVHAQRGAVDGLDLHHAAAGGDRDQRVRLAGALQREPVGVRVRVADVDRLDAQGDARVGERAGRVGQALVVGLPAEQAAEQAHVGALALVGRGQGSLAVELHQDLGDVAVHQVARQPPDAQRGRAVRARRPAHHGADDVVEDADVRHAAS
jgi:hypothetical protein